MAQESVQYWLLKVEPSDYPFDKMKSDGKTVWSGVRNHQAQKYLRTMKTGDLAFYFHTEKEKAIVGIVRVCTEFYLTDDPKFGMVDVEYYRALKDSVSLQTMKQTDELEGMTTLKQPRLSVSPVTQEQWKCIIEMSDSREEN